MALVTPGIRPAGAVDANGTIIQSNYFDLAMLMDYWGPARLNHHTEATSMQWDDDAKRWLITTDRGDQLSSRFVVICGGVLHKAKIPVVVVPPVTTEASAA